MLFSVIIPVYNRPDEVRDLLDSLLAQRARNFEVIIVEDGSTVPCSRQCDEARAAGLDVKYFYKDNEGRSIARNYGMVRAKGDYFVFFDSDCVIPPEYFETVSKVLAEHPTDCYGGPDAAHSSFITTGGIRGGKVALEKFTPRTFNMGFSRRVYEVVGGFREMFSEDIDMSKRIARAGFATSLIADAPVWHKRRVDFRKFLRQVYVFGMSRITLKLLYPDSLKAVHTLPAVAVLLAVIMVVLAITVSPWWLLPIGIYLVAVFTMALAATRSVVIAAKAVPAAVIQLGGYGVGFIRAYFTKIILRRGRDVNREIEMRRGK